jgi:sugar lactone lactonase YvrE
MLLRPFRFAFFSAAVLACTLTACGSTGAEDAAPKAAWGEGQAWRLVEETRIGAMEGNGPEVFGIVVDVTLDPLGRAWIADGQQQDIRVFDDRGRHVRTIGRKGAGPAEFMSIGGMRWESENRLWVLDGGNARFAIYDTAGTLVETRPRQSALTTSPWPGRFDDQGRLYDVDGDFGPDGAIRTSIVRSAPGARSRDTFQIPPFKEEVFEITRGDKRNQHVTQVNVPFTGTQFWALDPEGYVWIANTAEYRIERHAFTGAVERVVQQKHRKVPVEPGERERRLDDYRDFVRQGGRIDVSRIPSSYPALHGFLFDDEGHLWVSPITGEQEGRVLDVFELGGRYLGRVALPTPRRSSPRIIRNGRMLVVARDSLDVQSIVVLRLDRSAG